MFTIIVLPWLYSCKSDIKDSSVQEILQEPQQKIPSKQIVDLDSLNNQYVKLRNAVGAYQSKAVESDASNEEIQAFLFNIISNDYYKYWEGTDWDFNGITETPRNGMIACGYYVTTNLKHAGFNLNRYKFAQQLGSVIINSMCEKTSIKRLVGLERLEKYLEAYSDDRLFVLAMDNHVGFAVRKNGISYFMHSGFTGKAVVVKEVLASSDIIQGSYNFMIGDLLGNDRLINQWKSNSKIQMVK